MVYRTNPGSKRRLKIIPTQRIKICESMRLYESIRENLEDDVLKSLVSYFEDRSFRYKRTNPTLTKNWLSETKFFRGRDRRSIADFEFDLPMYLGEDPLRVKVTGNSPEFYEACYNLFVNLTNSKKNRKNICLTLERDY
ncbi:MAG: hypothetical protein WC533_02370 [Candidatus Pacearchaeota archaeon]